MNDVLITGASSGIGRQLALDYARDGFQVIACGRNLQRLQALSAEHANIETLVFDVNDRYALQAAMDSLVSVPKLIILNAGNCEYLDNGRINSALVERVFNSNFFGVIKLLEVIQDRIAVGTHIGVVGSSVTFLALPRAEAYGASKAALSYFINSLRLDWQHKKTTFSLISPGFVKTPLTDKNTFAMPMLVSASKASSTIRLGLLKRQANINFPKAFIAFLSAIALLPMRWQARLISRMTGATQ
jgi:short-subunit dehydrogenase